MALFPVLAAACGSQPVPLAARPGSTIGIAVGSEVLEGTKIGYGGTAFAAESIADEQRGELVIQLEKNQVVVATLTTVLVTRSMPDPASEAGITNQTATVLGVSPGISQVIAIARIPATGVPPDTYKMVMRRRDRTGAILPDTPLSQSPVNDASELTILPGDPVAETPLHGIFPFAGAPVEVPLAGSLFLVYPHPKLVLTLSPATARAAHFVLRYPAAKIDQVRSVFEEQHFGRGSIVLFTDEPAQGRVTVDFSDPTGTDVPALAAALKLRTPFAGTLQLADFSFEDVVLYDAGGAPIAGGAVSAAEIR